MFFFATEWGNGQTPAYAGTIEGGKVTLARIAGAVKRACGADSHDVRNLARMAVFAVAIGNLDMHAKNLAILHPEFGPPQLAPAYDVVPQVHMSKDGQLALAVNKKYLHADITRNDLVREISSWDVADAEGLVDSTLYAIAEAVAAETPLPGAAPDLQRIIGTFTTNLQTNKPAGSSRSQSH